MTVQDRMWLVINLPWSVMVFTTSDMTISIWPWHLVTECDHFVDFVVLMMAAVEPTNRWLYPRFDWHKECNFQQRSIILDPPLNLYRLSQFSRLLTTLKEIVPAREYRYFRRERLLISTHTVISAAQILLPFHTWNVHIIQSTIQLLVLALRKMRPVTDTLELYCSVIDTIRDKLISFQPIRNEYLR